MDCIEKTQNELYTHKFYYHIELTRYTILNIGYKIVVLKSKIKKTLITLRRQIISFYF